MHRWTTVLSLLALAVGGAARPAWAQIDYRNLDDDRPLVTEDAYPVERYGFEFLLPYAFERETGGGQLHAFVPELEYGIIRNGQLGIQAPVAGVEGPGDTDWGLAGLRVFGLYNFNTESPVLPALSARADLLLPVGSLGGDVARLSLKAIATRSWGRNRVHLNLAWTAGKEAGLSAVEPGSRWAGSLAFDRTLFRQNLLLAGEIATSQIVEGAPVEIDAAVGARYQWTPTTVLDVGFRRRLRQEVGPDLGLTIGLSHAFALAWLMPPGNK
jgi:hypothetical protein